MALHVNLALRPVVNQAGTKEQGYYNVGDLRVIDCQFVLLHKQ